MQQKYPFSLIASQQLGTRYSSLEKIGSFKPLECLGGAKLQFFVNIATGNLIFKDHILSIEEAGGPIEIYYTYNSQVESLKNLWQFSSKKFTTLSVDSPIAILQETDGHMTTYNLDTITKKYRASICSGEGTPQLYFDKNHYQWIWIQPGNNITEYYNMQGYLQKRIDHYGRILLYSYDSENQLIEIRGQSGSRYQIQRTNNNKTINIYFLGGSIQAQLLHCYQCDDQGRIIKSQTADGYETIYSYGNNENSWQLWEAKQSDQTIVQFNYQYKKLINFTVGQESVFNIAYIDDTHPKCLFTDTCGHITQIGLNTNADITDIITSKDNTVCYYYNTNNQLETIIHPNGGKEYFSYANSDNDYMLQLHIKPDRQTIEKIYQKNGDKILLASEIQYESKEFIPLVTHYIYNDCFLRFKISPAGRVTEYRPDKNSNIASERKYLSCIINLSQYPYNIPSLSDMLSWTSKQDPQQITLTEYQYNNRGQLIYTRQYAQIDNCGQGIADAQMGEIFTFSNIYGNWFQQRIKHSNQNFSTAHRVFDSLQRLIRETDSINRTTNYIYKDSLSQLEIIYPNKRIEIHQKNTKGQVITKQETISSGETRSTFYNRDTQGRIILTMLPDGQTLYNLYDPQDRLEFTITTLGKVTQYIYNLQNRWEAEIQYVNYIDIPKKIENLISKIIFDSILDRINYTFYDLSERILYKVDENQYITQYFYDNRDHNISKIAYANPLTLDQLNALKKGQALTLIFDFIQDRCKRFFYDYDGYLIAKQNAGGFVTEYIRDKAGNIQEKIQYGCAALIDLNITDFNAVRPSITRDAHTYYFRNARGFISAQIDPENNYTQYNYYPNGLIYQNIQFLNKSSKISPMPPEASPAEDQIIIYQYDLSNRIIKKDFSYDKSEFLEYDVMDNIICKKSIDTQVDNAVDNTNDPDFVRITKTYYNDWNEKNTEINLFGGQISHAYNIGGLKTHTTDALGYRQYYFYDKDCRLIATVDPNGSVSENIFNTFGEIIKTRKYAKLISPDEILEGGLITPNIRALFIEDDNSDQISVFIRDNRGQICQKIYPEGAVTVYHYNAFKQIIEETLPVTDNTARMTIIHTFESRGYEILNFCHANGIYSAPILRFYDSISQKEIFHLEGYNNYKITYNLCGQMIQKDRYNHEKIISHQFTCDAFGRITTQTDSLGNMTVYQYNQKTRTHTVISPMGTKQIITHNIFNEIIIKTDGLNHSQQWKHAPDGQISYYKICNLQLENQYDLMGQKIKYQDFNQTQTVFIYDGAGCLTKKIEDTTGFALKTQYQRDAFGNAITVTDPRQVITQHIFNKCNQLIKIIQDAKSDGLYLITQKSYNQQGKLISLSKSNLNIIQYYQENYQVDDLNRTIGKIIDPNGLNINTQQHLNPMGKIISETDPNGNITRKFYDNLGQLRLVVDPQGGVIETAYNTEGNIIFTRHYENPVDITQLNDKTDIKTCLNLINPNIQDSALYYFYDADGKERFQINHLGSVIEKQYNITGHEIKIIKYSNQLEIKILNILLTLTTNNIIFIMKNKTNSNDRTSYKILDERGRERFLIDSENYLSEKRYDAAGNIIAKIQYAYQLSDPQIWQKLSDQEICYKLNVDSIIDNLNDRASYQIFDALNRPQYAIDSEGVLTQFWHDENHNLIQTAVYENAILGITSASDSILIQKLIIEFLVHPGKARVTQYQYNAVNQKIRETDALGYSDIFQKDSLGNTLVHMDKNNNSWDYQYDAANRLKTETTPIILIANTKLDNKKQQLNYTQTNLSIENQKIYDQTGNLIRIIKSSNLENPRVLNCNYNKNNQLIQTCIYNINIDDTTQLASFDRYPVKKQDIITMIVYNAKKLKIAEQNESGFWYFYIYDAEGRLSYQINPSGFIKQNFRNAFGEIIQETAYANKINLDLNSYFETGISLKVLQTPGIIIPSSDDRTKIYTRDKRGNVILTQSGPIFYYIPGGNNHPQYHWDYSQTRQQYNAFQECFYKSVLLDPYLSLYSQQLYWFDRRGKILAECNPVFNIILHNYDSFGNEIDRIEWANSPALTPTPETSLAVLKANYISSLQDRIYHYEYDLLGRCTHKTLKNCIIQKAIVKSNSLPVLKNQPIQDLTQIYEYNAIGKKIAVTYEDGSKAYLYYDARGLILAATDVPRQNANGTTLIPLSYYGNDAFGQRVMTTRFKAGTASASLEILPIPIFIDPDDQIELKLLDLRGLPAIKQNAENCLEGFTYTSTKKIAREWHYLTNHDNIHIDEKRYQYNQADQLVSIFLCRDNQAVQITAFQYNAFGNCIAEGSGDNTWPLYRRYNVQNYCWSTNQTGIKTISLTNLSGQETVKLQSPTQDLSQIAYTPESLNFLLNSDITNLERTETQRDSIGRKIVSTQPKYEQYNPNDPTNIPINIITGESYPAFGKTSLTWRQPKTNNYTLKIKLWPMANPTQITEPLIKTIGTRSGIDVSSYATDVYVYEMDYYYTNPITHEIDSAPRYRTTGEIQFDTGNNTHSLMLVVSITNGSLLHLSGNTTGITGISLWQGNIKLSELPVLNKTVDLSKFTSGIYTVTPIIPGKDNLPGSLRFTLHTYIPSGEPLSTQIDSIFQLSNLWIYLGNFNGGKLEREVFAANFNWQVPEYYKNLPINLSYTYRRRLDAKASTFQGTIQAGEVKNDYGPWEKFYENEGGISACNHYYYPSYEDGEVAAGANLAAIKIENLSFSLKLNNKDTLLIANMLQPCASSGTGILKSLITDFPPISIIYLTPIDSSQLLEYLDITMDRLAVWKPINILGKTSQGVYFDVTTMEPGIYPFRIKGQLHFWEASKKLNRKLSASLSTEEGKTLSLSFQEIIPIKDNGYSFQLLKTTRKAVSDILASQKKNKMIRERLAPVICQLFMAKSCNLLDDIYYWSSLEAYENYINYLKTNGDIDVQTALITAQQQGFSIFFWEKDSSKYYSMKLVAFYDAGSSAFQALHFNLAGISNFDVLLPNGVTLESLYGKQAHYTFTVEPPAGSPYPSNQFEPSYPVEIQPSTFYQYDPWHNLIQKTDTLGNITNYNYYYNNQLFTQIQPEVSIIQSDNTIKRNRPVTQYAYNTRGFKIGMIDPNGNTEIYLLNTAGQEITRILGDGLTIRKQDFDTFGRRINYTDALNATWQHYYNHQNAIKKILSPLGKSKTYFYNELNYRTKDIDESKCQITYDYDIWGNISTRTSNTGLITHMKFDRNHKMLSIDYPDGTRMSWIRDYFGVVHHHTDLSNVEYAYWLDSKNQVTRKFSHFNNTRINYKGSLDIYTYNNLSYYSTLVYNISNQDISFSYSGGKLLEVIDSACQNWMAYIYDSENREIAIQSNTHKINTHFDELGREVQTDDGEARISIAYDASGNRRHIIIYCVKMQEIWYAYDAANRVIYDGNTGLTLSYEAGLRSKEANSKGTYRTLAYDNDGILTNIDYYQLTSSIISTHREYTPNGILINYTEGNYFNHIITVDSEGWQRDDQQILDGQTVSHTTYSNFTSVGLPLIQNSEYVNNIQDHMNNGYTGYEVQELTSVSGTRTDPYGTGNCATARRYFDANGNVSISNGLQDDLDPNSKTPISKLFLTNHDGRILQRTTVGPPIQAITADNPWGNLSFTRYFYNTRGEMFASYGTDISNSDQYNMTLNYLQHCQNRFQSFLQGVNIVKNFETQARAPRLILPDFIQSYPASAPETYIVSSGDTFSRIAERLLGDANFGSAIAGKNGLSPDDSLFTGQVLQIPQYLPHSNNANNTTPYEQFISIILGNLYPHLDLKQPPPPPQQKHHSGGFFGEILGDVVHAIVETVAAIVGGIVGGPFAPIVASIFTGLADAAYQGVAVELNWQDHFSLRTTFTTGLEAGIATAVSQINSASVFQILSHAGDQEMRELLIKTATITVSNQLAEMATRERTQFDLSAILAQTGSAFILQQLVPAEDKILEYALPRFTKNLLKTETAELISTGLTAIAESQKINIEAIAASALGVNIGEQLGEIFKQNWQSRDQKATESYDQVKNDSINTSLNNSVKTTLGFFNQKSQNTIWVKNNKGNWIKSDNSVPFPKLKNNIPSLNEILQQDSTLNIVADEGVAQTLYDKSSKQYFVYDNMQGLRPMEQGIESIAPEMWIAGGADIMKASVDITKFFIKKTENLLSKIGLFQEKNTAYYFNPNQIRYSQESISYSKSRGNLHYTLNDIISSMSQDGWQGDPIDIIKMPEGGYSSLDNSRIFSARQSNIDAYVRVHKYNERIPVNMAGRFSHPQFPEFYAKIWGEALEFRIMRQSLNFIKENFPVGTYENPRINYPKDHPNYNSNDNTNFTYQ